MILVDTSVVIDRLTKKDAKLNALFASLDLSICGVTKAELLWGVRRPSERVEILNLLATVQFVLTPEASWEAIGDYAALIRSRGISVGIPDVILATLALQNGCELWTRDRDFLLIQTALPALQLFAEPA